MPRIGIAGAGAFGANHVRVAAAHLAGVYDLDPARAAVHNCRVFESLEELAANCDAAIVATPTTTHADVACSLLEAGLDVLVEKPIAATPAEARRIIDAARAGNRILQVGHLERFNPAVMAAQALLTKPLFFEIHRLSVFSPRSLDVDVIADLMIHDLDILLAMVGQMPSAVHAAGIHVLSDKVDIANVRLEFPGGCIANLTASRVSTERVRKLRLFQPRMYVAIDYSRQDLLAIRVDDDKQVHFLPQSVAKDEPLKLQFQSFVECIRTRSTPVVDGTAALRALEAADIILQKIAEHQAIVQRSLQG